MGLLWYLFILSSSFFISYFTTPLIRQQVLKRKSLRNVRKRAIDKPDSRKIHKRVITRLGGLAIYAAFFIVIGITYLLKRDFARNFSPEFAGLFAGGTIILILGIYDDLKGTNAWIKFSFQIVAALVVIQFGFKIDLITNPFGEVIKTGWAAIPVTVIWIVAITNTINLIDGLDGLAAGVSAIVSLTLFLTGMYVGNVVLAVLTAALAGSTLGFLRYNFSPAKIFMGDTGSLFLGFTLAVIAIEGTQKSAATVAIFIPIIAMGLPIIDTLLAVIRRLLKGVHIFRADNEHIHHQLLKIGLSHRRVVLILYMVTVLLGIIAFVFTALKNEYIAVILFVIGIIVYVGIRKLGFIEFKQLKQNRNNLNKDNDTGS